MGKSENEKSRFALFLFLFSVSFTAGYIIYGSARGTINIWPAGQPPPVGHVPPAMWMGGVQFQMPGMGPDLTIHDARYIYNRRFGGS